MAFLVKTFHFSIILNRLFRFFTTFGSTEGLNIALFLLDMCNVHYKSSGELFNVNCDKLLQPHFTSHARKISSIWKLSSDKNS